MEYPILKQLIREALKSPIKKDTCNCGCHSCENVGNKGPVVNKDLKIKMTENMKYHVDNKLPLTETKLTYGSKEFLDLWAEARYLYSRNAIHVNEIDKKFLTKTNLGEYGICEGIKVPLDLPIYNKIVKIEENHLSTKLDADLNSGTFMLPYQELLDKIETDFGKNDLYYEIEQAIFDGNFSDIVKILKNYEVDKEYFPLLNLNENKFLYKYNSKTRSTNKIIINSINEDSASKLYKIEGLLITNNKIKPQNQILSDVRSITGITTVDTEEYTPRLPKKGHSYDKLTVKVDPYPYLKNGKFDEETLKQIIDNINNIRGIVKFKADPQLINIGI